ncbi:MAG: hypothetical protein ABFS35_23610 [Bacteroidota bacterium]
MCLLCKKIIFLFYYVRAINYASREEYLEAGTILNKAPFKEKFYLYYLLSAFLYERVYKFQESLLFYDQAKYFIHRNTSLNDDEKNYLFLYINYGYIYIYKVMEQFSKADKIIKENQKISFDIEKVHKSIKKDFVVD